MATRRPDLEAMAYKTPGFIGMELFPALNKAVKAGTYYYADIQSDAAAQTDRTLASAPTATAIGSASGTWSMAEAIKRYKMDESEIEQLGGLENAQALGARIGKRSVMATLENAAIAATFGDIDNINTRDILDSFLGALTIAMETVQDYADGPIALFGSRRTINRLKRYDEITARMVYTGVPISSVRDVRSISDQQLAAAIGVDRVLAGPSAAAIGFTGWLGAASAYEEYLGVCVLPDAGAEPVEEVQFGRYMVMPVPAAGAVDNLHKVETYYSDDLKSEVVDVTAWRSLEILNKEVCYILTGVDESNATTTTSTTTTTTTTGA